MGWGVEKAGGQGGDGERAGRGSYGWGQGVCLHASENEEEGWGRGARELLTKGRSWGGCGLCV